MKYVKRCIILFFTARHLYKLFKSFYWRGDFDRCGQQNVRSDHSFYYSLSIY
ncbi:MAG: hypothetical protein K0Q56_1196 [Sporolactobacillus laevolacticus]|nr:hypothetical protein [Sporolactobacillus laevolacticus]